MNKVYLLSLVLLLGGCSTTGYTLFSAYVETDYSNGVLIRNHTLTSSSSEYQIQLMAASNCRQKGYDTAVLKDQNRAGEYLQYLFECKKNETENKLSTDSFSEKDAIKECVSLGFKKGTEGFLDCVEDLKK